VPYEIIPEYVLLLTTSPGKCVLTVFRWRKWRTKSWKQWRWPKRRYTFRYGRSACTRAWTKVALTQMYQIAPHIHEWN